MANFETKYTIMDSVKSIYKGDKVFFVKEIQISRAAIHYWIVDPKDEDKSHWALESDLSPVK